MVTGLVRVGEPVFLCAGDESPAVKFPLAVGTSCDVCCVFYVRRVYVSDDQKVFSRAGGILVWLVMRLLPS